MSLAGMYMLNSPKYSEARVQRALDMLYQERKNEFRELSEMLLPEKALPSVPHWKEFVLNFCLEVEASFKAWSGQTPLDVNSPQKALTILRRLGRDMPTMNRLVHVLNMCYDISVQFREIYKRLD